MTRDKIITYDARMEDVLKALGDSTRRDILDRLRERDGQTLSELTDATPMTRFGVMKHLALLEEAGLVLTRRSGRFKHHYLNVIPLQQVVDRWIEPLTRAPAARALLNLKTDLEREAAMTTNATKPDFMLETFIAAPPARVWEALTSRELSAQYYIAGAALHGSMEEGSRYEYRTKDGAPMLAGTILASEPGRRLDMTFEPGWVPGGGASRNVYELAEVDGLTKLTILHYDLPAGQEGVKEGWARIASALKTLLETGRPLLAA